MNFLKSHKTVLLFVLLILFSCGVKDPGNVKRPESTVVHPDWSYNKTVYEVNIRQFSESGTFKAIEQRLPGLKELGVGIVWLMPVHPIGEKSRKGSLGSYYSLRDYYKVNPEFGTDDDFKSLVNKIHELGMYVIIDWVANHTAWDNSLVDEHPDWFTRDENNNLVSPVPDWSDVVDLNYENRELWNYMTDAMRFWVMEYDIDGFRCDAAEWVPLEFWEQARAELEKIRPVFMLAEGENPDLQFAAFDMTYSWGIHHAMNKIAKGEDNAGIVNEYLKRESREYPENAFRMRFTSNHDENSCNGTVFERLGEGAKSFAVLSATIPGKPLLYSGQETGMDKRLEFFEKDPIEWKESDFRPFYTKLYNLYQQNPALYAGKYSKIKTDEDKSVYIFVREQDQNKMLVVLNLSDQRIKVNVKSDLLTDFYRELFSDVRVEYVSPHQFDLEPWAYRIFVKEQRD